MESNSIVSFSNDSTFQSTLKTECNNVSVHELALHAMRDRCLLLQRRINTLETDNMRLKLDMTKTSKTGDYDNSQDQLHQKIAELNKQKSNLMHHVFMVTCENRSLWNKISNINKRDKAHIKSEGNKHAPLLRTNTYIHSTPKHNDPHQEKFSESSLEEISLKLINSYIQEKSQLVEQYEQMAQLQDFGEDVLNVDSIGFTFIEDPGTDSLKEIHNQTQKLLQLKKELLQQEQDLKIVYSRVESIIKDGHKCLTCNNKGSKNISSEHKEIETSDSLANFATPADSTTYNENLSELNTYKKDILDTQTKQISVSTDKICPMCGELFSKEVEFSEFQAHVEHHFTRETDLESNIDDYEDLHSVNNVI